MNYQITDRIKALRKKVIDVKPTVCLERARIYTEVYKKYESKPIVIKRALALKETLQKMTIMIEDGELLVGNQASVLKAAPIFPEYGVNWIIDELETFNKRPGDKFYLSEEDKKDLKNICTYWHGKTLIEKGYEIMPSLYKDIHESGIIRAEGNLTSGDGHIIINYEKVLEKGISGYAEIVENKRSKLNLWKKSDLKKELFYNGVKIALEGVRDYIERYRKLALSEYRKEINLERKAELKKIASNCENIKDKPPEDFYQALQLVCFIQLFLQIESNGHSVSLGRLDQYLYPYYKKDLQANKIQEQFVAELLENLCIKIYSFNKIRSWSHTKYSMGSPLYQNITIGGQTIDGADAVNELSYLILHAVKQMKLPQPNLSVRYHKNIDENFIMDCIKVIEKGFGMPAFNNDEIIIPSLMRIGIEKKDAYNYSVVGCIEVAIPGKWGYRCTGMSFLNLMRVFLSSLRGGYDAVSKKVYCNGTGDFEDYSSFDDVMNAWKKQIEFYAQATVIIDTAVDVVIEENVPDILCSTFVDNCLQRGKTLKEGGAKYDFISGLQVGIANLGNALAAIKKLVFDDKVISKKELIKNLNNNFYGVEGEKVRQLLLNNAPKFGNDDDYVDDLVKESYMYFIEAIEKYYNTRYGRGPLGGGYFAGTSSISANVPTGAAVPATPDGRKAFEPVAEGASPTAGTDSKGPTAVFHSIAKLPTERILGGVLLNQKLSPRTIENEENKKKLASLIKTFFIDLKGWHVQYNIVSKKDLIEAKKNPEEYRDLIVRVAGYSAFFNILAPDMQDDIINRTEHQL